MTPDDQRTLAETLALEVVAWADGKAAHRPPTLTGHVQAQTD